MTGRRARPPPRRWLLNGEVSYIVYGIVYCMHSRSPVCCALLFDLCFRCAIARWSPTIWC